MVTPLVWARMPPLQRCPSFFCWRAFGGSQIDRKVSKGVCNLDDQTASDLARGQNCPCFAEVEHCSSLVGLVGIESQCSRLILTSTSDAARVTSLERRVAVLVSAAPAGKVGGVKVPLENHATLFPLSAMVEDWW